MSETNSNHNTKRLLIIVLAIICVIIVFFVALGILISSVEKQKAEAESVKQQSQLIINEQKEDTRQRNLDRCYQDADSQYNSVWRSNCDTVYQNCLSNKATNYLYAKVNCQIYNPENPNCNLPSETAKTLESSKQNARKECLQRYSN